MSLIVLEKRELEDMKLFSHYIGKIACPTQFSLATGLISFANKDHMICSSYFVNDTNEISYSQIIRVTEDGIYRYSSKADKYLIGVRPAISTPDLDTKLILDGQIVNRDLSIMEYGYYPKCLIKKQIIKEDTGVKIKLPISDKALSKSEFREFPVYVNPNSNIYFIEYPIYSLCTRIGDEIFNCGDVATFEIEPVRFWVDNTTGLCISQDVIQGGVSYKMYSDSGYEYDDYYESDLYEAVEIMEENMIKLTRLIKQPDKEKKKEKK